MLINMIGQWIWNWLLGWGGLGGIACIAAWALWYFCPAILLQFKSLLLHIAVGLTVFVVASTTFFTKGYNTGYHVAINAIAKKDQAAVARVNSATARVDACLAKGGDWDVTTGACDR